MTNLSTGGAKIGDVCKQVDSFYVSNHDVVSQVFVSVGPNDIRDCRANGEKHLKEALSDLANKIKLLFPDAKVWFQCLIQLPEQHKFSIKNVNMYNNLLWEVCSNSQVYYMDCFSLFLGFNGYRREFLFKSRGNIHPNNFGLGILTRCYITLIHPRTFNPLGY